METVKTRQKVIKMIRPTPNDMDDEKIVYSAYIRAESSRMALKRKKRRQRFEPYYIRSTGDHHLYGDQREINKQ